ncbi:MAG TPA: sigma 54-interacting transcriptional regulator [Puia sp.]|nr:sigma 54-interacting transcriptional regulator [Puia sp.]
MDMNFLLSLSAACAITKTRKQLRKTIDGLLRTKLQFDHSTIFMPEREGNSVQDIFFDEETSVKDNPFYRFIPLRADSSCDASRYLKDKQSAARCILVKLAEGDLMIGHWILLYPAGKASAVGPPDEKLLSLLGNQLSIVVSRIMAEAAILDQAGLCLTEESTISPKYPEIIGDGPAMQKVFHKVSQVAPSGSSVLILGETGTGKELVARAIHNGSPRKNKVMIKVNCAALPANLIESELFGHERGSFTGAVDRRIGKFELANGGTLFLDEIGEMPLELQVKLLRAIQEREIERVGGRSTIKIDVRIIAATNRDLEKGMEEGSFRTDLYYRLNIFPISLPPLRDHPEDIPLLISHFIQQFGKKAGRKINPLNGSALQELMRYKWPGNIRELEHLIERSALQSTGETIEHIHLLLSKNYSTPSSCKESFVPKTIHEHEREFILKTIRYCSGVISGEGGAAQLLGVPPSTLNSKMKRLGIRREHVG